MKAQFKTWNNDQKVTGLYMGKVAYTGTINDKRSRPTPDGRSFIFVVDLASPITVYGQERNRVEIWENSDDTIELA